MEGVRKELAVAEYDTLGGRIAITLDDITNYLAKGTTKLTDREAILFLQLCKSQRLNPWTGEAYPIKFGNDFQMVVGYETYKRRAEDNPEYIGRKSGIVVVRGNEVIQKEGTCLYPNEELIGGWCRVYRLKHNKEDETFKEVGLKEYQKMKDGKPSANWGTKPCTMIEKVAVSQALRAAFPKDFEGLYTESEMGTQSDAAPSGSSAAQSQVVITNLDGEPIDTENDKPLSHSEKIQLFEYAKQAYGDDGVGIVQDICRDHDIFSTKDMTRAQYNTVVDVLNARVEADGIPMMPLGDEFE